MCGEQGLAETPDPQCTLDEGGGNFYFKPVRGQDRLSAAQAHPVLTNTMAFISSITIWQLIMCNNAL